MINWILACKDQKEKDELMSFMIFILGDLNYDMFQPNGGQFPMSILIEGAGTVYDVC